MEHSVTTQVVFPSEGLTTHAAFEAFLTSLRRFQTDRKFLLQKSHVNVWTGFAFVGDLGTEVEDEASEQE